MKNSLKRELFANILIMMLLITLIVIVGIISVQTQKKYFDRIIVEYHEINAIYDLSYSLRKTAKSVDNYLLLDNPDTNLEFQENINELALTYNNCKAVITERHSKKILAIIEEGINKIVKTGNEISENDRYAIYNKIDTIIQETDKEIIKFQQETREEIEEYIEINNKLGSFRILLLITVGLVIIIGSLFWGLNFVKKRTIPIIQLIDFTRKIGEGDLNHKADIKFGNELDSLTISFNKMVETLNYTTISKDYFNNILNSIVDLIIVTDDTGNIKLINFSALKILGYSEQELLQKNIMLLFPGYESDTGFLNTILLNENNKNQNGEFIITTKNNQQIAVLLSTSILRKDKHGSISTIIVAHDITEKNKIEKQLETERKEKAVAIFEAQEEERLRVASDLHDGLGQMLTGILYFIENNLTGEKKENVSKNTIDFLQNQIDAAIKETKSIAHNIIPMLLKDFGLVIAIKKMATQINSNNKFNIRINEFNFETRLEPKIEKILYRICQEALNNIIKHSYAKNINIQLIKHNHSVVLLIDDDGVGFEIEKADFKKNSSGIGLISMKERVSALNGTFSISSEKNKGTEILIEIPC